MNFDPINLSEKSPLEAVILTLMMFF